MDDDMGSKKAETPPPASRKPEAPPPPPVYTAPAPPKARPTSWYLLFAVNLLIFAALVWWVIQRSGEYQPPASAEPAKSPAAATTRAGQVPGPERPGPNMTQPGGPGEVGTKVPGPAEAVGPPPPPPPPKYDAATLEQIRETRDGMERMGVQLEVLRSVRGAYPTSNVPEYGRNRGIEAVVKALEDAGRLESGKLSLGDADGDGRREVLDPWGNPLVYFSHDDYATTQGWGGEGPEGGAAIAYRSGVREGWHAMARFQLWSAGPDRRNDGGTGDDVVSWEIRERRELR